VITATLKSRICIVCHKETTRWTDKPDYDKCECGGQLEDKYRIRIADGDGEEYWCRELGVGPAQREAYLRAHPGAEIREDGAIKVKNYAHQKQLLRESGMVELDKHTGAEAKRR
jgi:hypothetical protein